MTNLEGRVIRRRMALPPPDGRAGPTSQMLAELAGRLGRGQYFSADPRAVFDELRRASAGGPADYAGITYERIDAEQGVFWPCPSDGPSRHAAAVHRAVRDTGRPGRGSSRVEHRAPAETPETRVPVRAHHRPAAAPSTRAARRPGGVAGPIGAPSRTVQLHPTWPARTGDRGRRPGGARRSRRGTAMFRRSCRTRIRPDTLFVPFHWGGASARTC